MKNIIVTGGAGFIGANFVLHMLKKYNDYHIIVYDKLTYAGNLDNLLDVKDNPRYAFVQGDICDAATVEATIQQYDVDTIVNFAAETHVDRSIMDPDAFIQTSVYGTYVLLEAAKKHGLRYHQISTDEVYGHIPHGYSSVESDKLDPRMGRLLLYPLSVNRRLMDQRTAAEWDEWQKNLPSEESFTPLGPDS